MARWSTVSNGQTFVVEATPSGEVVFDIQPAGPFVTRADLADEILAKIATAIGVARSNEQQQ